jgi:hypothetical protein
MLDTSRVPLIRLSSTSAERATCCKSKALRSASAVQKVSATIGTSSMPFGLITGWPRRGSAAASRYVRMHRVVEAEHGVVVLHADVELNGDDGHARP